jgi:CxxC motif-containing protein (DUF1111 family)
VSTGCALCHTPTLATGNAKVPALSGRAVDLYSDLLVAIQAHQSGGGRGGSEANTVTANFNRLPEAQKQDILNFLRSL